MNVARTIELSKRAEDLTRRYPPGTPCRFWPGVREGPGRQGVIRSSWAVLSGQDIVVWIEDYPGCIAATHVECEEVYGNV